MMYIELEEQSRIFSNQKQFFLCIASQNMVKFSQKVVKTWEIQGSILYGQFPHQHWLKHNLVNQRFPMQEILFEIQNRCAIIATVEIYKICMINANIAKSRPSNLNQILALELSLKAQVQTFEMGDSSCREAGKLNLHEKKNQILCIVAGSTSAHKTVQSLKICG
jgi:hypothetical protein